MALNPAHNNPGCDGWTVAESIERLKRYHAAKTDGDVPYRQNAEHWFDHDLYEQDVRAVVDLAEKLAAFKSFVHARLDAGGVPTHPDGPHSKEGCRIGDRLDWVIGEWDTAHDELIMCEGELKLANGECDALRARVAELERLSLALADRVHKQSELLSRRAEAKS